MTEMTVSTKLAEYPVGLNPYEIGFLMALIDSWEQKNEKNRTSQKLYRKIAKLTEQFKE